jgi:hypothetical protein
MRRRALLVVAVIALLGALLGLFVVFVVGVQPIGHRWNSKGYTEPTCSEYDEVCNEGCRRRDSGPDCYGCCIKAKGDCDVSGDYQGHLKKCLVSKAASSKP